MVFSSYKKQRILYLNSKGFNAPEVKRVVESQMRLDDETTAYQLHALLNSKGYCLSLTTVLHYRTSLGWTFRGSAYCQLIREVNKQK